MPEPTTPEPATPEPATPEPVDLMSSPSTPPVVRREGRERGEGHLPPRMLNLEEEEGEDGGDSPELISRFYDAIKSDKIDDVRKTMEDAFYTNSLETLMNSTDPHDDLENPPLVVAAEKAKDDDILFLLISNGADVNATDRNGKGPLHHLAKMANSAECDIFTIVVFIKVFINAGADVFMKDNDGKTALEIHQRGNQYVINNIQKRIDVQPTFQRLYDIIDNVDEESIETVLADIETLPVDDYILTLENSEGLSILFYAIKYFAEPKHLTPVYEVLDDAAYSGGDRLQLLHLTFKGKTAPMVFLDKYPRYNPDTVAFLKTVCDDLENIDSINDQDLFGLTVLDYAEKTGQQEYIDIVRAIPGAKRGKDMPPNPNERSIFYDQPAVYPEKEQSRTVLASVKRKAPKLPEDPGELENMYFAEANKLISPTLTEEEAEDSLEIIDHILDKDSDMINKYIGDSGLTLIMFATKLPNSGDSIETLIQICFENDVDLVMKSSEGVTVLELAINEKNWNVVEILLNYSPLQGLIPEDKDCLKIYNLLNTDYDRYTEEEKIEIVKIIVKAVLWDLFNIVITSSSEDNYKWLPENVNPNIVNMNVGIEDFLPEENNYIKTVCMGVTETGEAIKNNAKILEFILKNGAHAYNANSYHEPMEDTPLALVLFERAYPSLPSAEMVKMLLDYGAQVYTGYAYPPGGDDSSKFIWDIIDDVEKLMDSLPSDLSAEEKAIYQEEIAKIISLLYQGIALQVILATPKSEDVRFDERQIMLDNLAKFHPEAFQNYPKPAQEFEVKEIDPNERVFDMITLDDIQISLFLNDDDGVPRANHIVLQDYDNPDSTFLIDLTNIRNAIEVDNSPLNPGDIDEDKVPRVLIENPEYDNEQPEHDLYNPTHIVQTYDPSNNKHVPGPGKKGGRAIMFQCHNFLSGSIVTVGSVNNLIPYFDLKGVAGWGGLIPLMEVYDKLLNKPVDERGQYFTYKVLDQQVNPLSGIGLIQWIGDTDRNRYGGRLNYVSGAHCQEGQYGNVTTIIPAKRAGIVRVGEDVRDEDGDTEIRGGKKKKSRSTRKVGAKKRVKTAKLIKKKTVNKRKMYKNMKKYHNKTVRKMRPRKRKN